MVDPARMSAVLGDFFVGHAHLDSEQKVQLMREALKGTVDKMIDDTMTDAQRRILLQGMEPRKVVERTVYESIILDEDINDEFFSAQLINRRVGATICGDRQCLN